jgi:NADPH-dependent glutamate synthase beta subunit-like oxidoreductase
MSILDWDIAGILDMGVRAETNALLGKEITIASLLKEGYEAVFLALGGWDSRLSRGAGSRLESPIPGTFLMLDVLRPNVGDQETDTSPRQVVVFGSGASVVQTVEKYKNKGAECITVLVGEAPSDSPFNDSDLKQLEAFSAAVVFEGGISRLFGENNTLLGIEYTNLGTHEKTTIPADELVFSAGRFPELIFQRVENEDDNETSPSDSLKWEGIEPYKRPDLKNQAGLFSNGDVFTDYSAAIKAIGAGRRAAASIHGVLYGITPELSDDVLTPESCIQNVTRLESVKEKPRMIMPLSDSIGAGKTEMGFSEKEAKAEASRCLSCGLICYEKS